MRIGCLILLFPDSISFLKYYGTQLYFIEVSTEKTKQIKTIYKNSTKKLNVQIYQCCGAGAGGAEIIWDLESELELEPKLSS